jgi:pectate lyase C
MRGARALQGMTKLSNGHWAHACILTFLAACGSETGTTPSPTGEAGAGAPATMPTAGATAGTTAGAAGRAGSTATGSAGRNAAAAGGSAGTTSNAGSTATAGTAAAGTGGFAATGGSSGSATAGTPAAGTTATAGTGGSAGKAGQPAAGSGGSAGEPAEPPEGGELDETYVVAAGQTFDGQGKRYTAGSALGDGSQSEDQQPMFRLEPGATLLNVVLGAPAADGIHCQGDATLRNIVWEDIGEDALTIKGEGTVKLDGGSAKNGDDKVFQINAASRFEVSNFKASNAGKFIRQNGGTDFKVEVVIDSCDISNMDEAIFRTDSDSSTVEMTNTRYSNIGDELFIGVSSGNITEQNNTEY